MTRTLTQLRDDLRRQFLGPERYVAARLEVVTPLGEPVFAVGGCWDSVAECYVDRPVTARVVKLKASQVEIGHAIAEYITARLAGDDSRPALLLAIGNRGGGKTWVLALLMVALALALPSTWQVGVSITLKQARELKVAIDQIAAPEWITADITDARDQRTEFCTGAAVLWLSAKNPKVLRQALLRFEHVLINEGQDQRETIFINAIGAIRSGGVVTVAANPPQDAAGDWVAVLYAGIAAGSHDGRAFILDAARNDAVSSATLGKIGRLLRMVNPAAADADAEGVIKLSGDLGYPAFSTSIHVGDPPAIGWIDVTRKLSAEAVRGGVGFDYVVGADFQRTPGCCASVGKLYRDERGQIVLWIREYVTTEGVEEDLSQQLVNRGYYPSQVDRSGKAVASALIVGDATGARQNAEHSKGDEYSFTRLRADGWTVIAPMEHWRTGRPWYPLVRDSRAQMHVAFTSRQVLLSSSCHQGQPGFPSLVESFTRAKVNPLGKFSKKGHLAHGPDTVRYLCWRFLPRAQPPKVRGMSDEQFNTLASIKPSGRTS